MRIQTFLLTATLMSMSSSALAGPISAVVVFGDSLSDNGNLAAAVDAAVPGPGPVIPAPPYALGRASNGPVAVEYLAQYLGLSPLLPAALGGTNYAVIGAATGEVPFPTPGDPGNTADNIAEPLGLTLPVPTGMRNAQLPLFLSSLTGPIDPDALFVVWGGPNDVFINPSLATVQAAADNIAFVLDTLYGAGARRFLIPSMPDLGLTPDAGNPLALTALSEAFNTRLFGNLKLRQSLPGIGIASFDTFSFFQDAVAGDLGFTNVTAPCVAGNILFAVRLCGLDDEEGYLFWDSSHPTTTAHKMLGGEFAEAAQQLAVPEPLSMTLVGFGLAAAVLRRRRAA
jgi:phospholipase/lecithinase/hemolysin